MTQTTDTVEECLPAHYFVEGFCPFYPTAIAVANLSGKSADITFTFNDTVPAGSVVRWAYHTAGDVPSREEIQALTSNSSTLPAGTSTTVSVTNLPEGTIEVSAVVLWAHRWSLPGQIATSSSFTVAATALPTVTPAEFAAATSGSPLMSIGTVTSYRTRSLPASLGGLSAARQTEITERGIVSLADYGVVRDGATDQWALVQQAFDEARENYLALDLGSGADGVILLSRPVVAYRLNNINLSCLGGSNPNVNVVAKGNPNDFPIFRLADSPDAINDFSDRTNRTAVFYLFSDIGPSCNDDTVPGTPEPFNINGTDFKNTGANGFHTTLSYIEIQTGGGGTGKEGCVGLFADGAQHASVQGIRVVSDSGTPIFAGFERLPGRLGGGFEYELVPNGDMEFGWYDSLGKTTQPLLGGMVVSAGTGTITDSVIGTAARMPMVCVNSYFSFDASVTRLWRTLSEESPFSSGGGSIAFMHCLIDLVGASAASGQALTLSDYNGGRDLLLRDVYVTGAGVGRPLFDDNGTVVNFTSANQYIETHEFIQKDSLGTQAGTVFKARFSTHPTARFDPVTGAEDKLTATVLSAGTAPAGFLQQGQFVPAGGNEPSLYDANVFDCLYNGGLNNRGAVDIGPELNAIIQQYGETHSIFLGAGVFFTSEPIRQTPNTRLFGAGMTYTTIISLDTWTTTEPQHIIESADSADGTAWLHELSLIVGQVGDGQNRNIGFTHWRTGAKSRVSRVACNEGNASDQDGVPSVAHLFTGNGGGMWRVSGALDAKMSADSDSYFLKLEDTTQPLTFWGFNPEHRKNNQRWIHAENSSNLRVYAIKTESSRRYGFFQNCSNIEICGFGVGAAPAFSSILTDPIFDFQDCSDVAFLLYNGNLFSNPAQGYSNPIASFTNGGSTVSSTPLSNIHNADLGSFDGTVFVHE